MTTRPTLTSIHGRNAGLDRDGYLIAERVGFRNKTTAVTSASTATTISNNGTALVTSISTQTWVLESPVPGVRKVFLHASTSTSTAARTISSTAATFQNTTSATYTSFSWIAAGGAAILEGQSTSRWTIVTANGATFA